MILQLNPPIPMTSPKGSGYANFMIDRGMDFDIEWVVFQDNGEIWSWKNRDVKLEKNITYGRNPHAPKVFQQINGVYETLEKPDDVKSVKSDLLNNKAKCVSENVNCLDKKIANEWHL